MANAHIVVVGNQKGGSGKSTTSMHLIVSLLQNGYTVGSIDLDDPQATLTRYLENRRTFMESADVTLPTPEHHLMGRSFYDNPAMARSDEETRLDACVSSLSASHDFVVIDTPGSGLAPVASDSGPEIRAGERGLPKRGQAISRGDQAMGRRACEALCRAPTQRNPVGPTAHRPAGSRRHHRRLAGASG